MVPNGFKSSQQEQQRQQRPSQQRNHHSSDDNDGDGGGASSVHPSSMNDDLYTMLARFETRNLTAPYAGTNDLSAEDHCLEVLDLALLITSDSQFEGTVSTNNSIGGCTDKKTKKNGNGHSKNSPDKGKE